MSVIAPTAARSASGVRRSRAKARSGEWRTWVLAAVIHGGWLALTAWHGAIPAPVLFVLGGWFVAWHGSLQHETIHRHPTRSEAVNALVGGWPLSLWLPYRIYRRSHRQHHATRHPGAPGHDPESRYLAPGHDWARRFALAEASLTGRLLLGPFLGLGRFVAEEVHRAHRRPRQALVDWGWHAVGLVPVLAWLAWVGLSLPLYLACFVLPGQMLTLLRGYAEHRAESRGPSRAATVQSRGALALLFLRSRRGGPIGASRATPDMARWPRGSGGGGTTA